MRASGQQRCAIYESDRCAFGWLEWNSVCADQTWHTVSWRESANEPLDCPVLGAFCLLDWRSQLAFSREMRRRKVPHVVVAVSTDSIWIVPMLSPHSSGCLECLRTWVRNNHPERARWRDLFDTGSAWNGHFALPGGSVWSLVGHFLTRYLQRHYADPERHRTQHELVVLELASLASRIHAFMADPNCHSCGSLPDDSPDALREPWQPRPMSAPDSFRYRAVDQTVLRKHFVDWRTGLVRRVFRDTVSSLMPMAVAESPIIGETVIERSFGRSVNWASSQSIAILEALERYGGHIPRGKRTCVRGSFADLRSRAPVIDPRSFTLHAPEQSLEPGYEYLPYSDSLEFNWVWALSVRRREPVLIPEQLAYYRLHDTALGRQNRFVYESSNGCALGGCLEEAILYGLLEVLERDAYLVNWYGRYMPVELALEDVADEAICLTLARANAQGLTVRVFDLGVEMRLPIVLALVHDPSDDAPVASYCASGAHFDPFKAIRSALVEVISSIGVYREVMPPLRERAQLLFADSTNVQGMHDHVLLYSLPEAAARLHILGPSVHRAPLEERYPDWFHRGPALDLTDELERLLERVLHVADDVIVVDQTFASLREVGLSCVKVLAPGLQPLSFGQQYRRIAESRIRRAASSYGVSPDAQGPLNPYPHNFP